MNDDRFEMGGDVDDGRVDVFDDEKMRGLKSYCIGPWWWRGRPRREVSVAEGVGTGYWHVLLYQKDDRLKTRTGV